LHFAVVVFLDQCNDDTDVNGTDEMDDDGGRLLMRLQLLMVVLVP